MQILLGYLLAINTIALVLAILDERRLARKLGRIPERALLALSLAGGAVGALLAQVLTGHKRMNHDYCASLTLIVFLQAGVVAALWSETVRVETQALYERVAMSFVPAEEEEATDGTHVSSEPVMPRRFGPGS